MTVKDKFNKSFTWFILAVIALTTVSSAVTWVLEALLFQFAYNHFLSYLFGSGVLNLWTAFIFVVVVRFFLFNTEPNNAKEDWWGPMLRWIVMYGICWLMLGIAYWWLY